MSDHYILGNLLTTAVAVLEMWRSRPEAQNCHKCVTKIFSLAKTLEYVLCIVLKDMLKIKRIQIQENFLFAISWLASLYP